MTPVRLEPGAPWSRVKHSTTALLFSADLKHLSGTLSESNGMDPDQNRGAVIPDLVPNCLQRFVSTQQMKKVAAKLY